MEIIIANEPIRFNEYVAANNIGLIGLPVKVNIQRSSDFMWWNGLNWASITPVDLICSELLNFPGSYYYDLPKKTSTNEFTIKDNITYTTQFKILSGPYTYNDIKHYLGQLNIDNLSISYDFTTYSKAIIKWSDIDGDRYWAYAYNSIGENPTTSAEIVSRDERKRFSEETPS